jgi:hypothetical protein
VKILREPLTTALRITRCIVDAAFAETLPGAPRGLRFKRLDWLDAHPDRIHITTESTVSGCYIHHRKSLAGTAANLVAAAGYSEEIFRGKMLQRSWHREYLQPGNEGKSAWLRRLMRGYFEIEFDAVEEKTTDQAPSPTPPRNHLRMVVNNDSAGVRP